MICEENIFMRCKNDQIAMGTAGTGSQSSDKKNLRQQTSYFLKSVNQNAHVDVCACVCVGVFVRVRRSVSISTIKIPALIAVSLWLLRHNITRFNRAKWSQRSVSNSSQLRRESHLNIY